MNKTDAALLGGALFSLVILAYGVHHKKGWRYWLVMGLLVPNLGVTIGYALGKAEPDQKDLATSDDASAMA